MYTSRIRFGVDMARQQVNVRLSSYTVGQLKELASRFDMSESTVIMLAIDRLARDTQQGEEVFSGNEGKHQSQPKGEQGDGNREATRTRRGNNHAAKRRKVGV